MRYGARQTTRDKKRVHSLLIVLVCLSFVAWFHPALAQTPDPDLNNDGIVNILDGSIVGSCFGVDLETNPQCICADTDGNGNIDLNDMNVVKGSFGQSGFDVSENPCVDNPNTAPIADAGIDQLMVIVGQMVTLDGSRSFDMDGDPLTYKWEVIDEPNPGDGALDDDTSVMPMFFADVDGTYVYELTVNDGMVDSTDCENDRCRVTISTNPKPVAVAKLKEPGDFNVGDTIALDGSDSFDVGGNLLTFSWTVSKPDGNDAPLDDPNAVMPEFVADVEGTYSAQLIVNDGIQDSDPDTIQVNVNVPDLPLPPVAVCELKDQNAQIFVDAPVGLEGSQSSDPDDSPGPLTFKWSVTTQPTNSTAEISDPSVSMPTMTPDIAGMYVVQLIVNDGNADSEEPCVIPFTTENRRPVANAGPDQMVPLDIEVTLDGSESSDPDRDPITFMWAFTSKPNGSNAELNNAQVIFPVFTPDVDGTYVLELIVNDGELFSDPTIDPNPTVVIQAGEGDPLRCGALISGSIDEASEVDRFTFSGAAGDVVAVTITGAQMAAKVFSPSGTDQTGFFTGTQRLVTLPESGTYVVEVVGGSFVATGDYSLGLECLVPPSPDAVALSCGSLVAGSMTAPSEADLYTFTGTAGDVVAVTITGAQMAAKVFSPSGTDQTGFFTGTQRLVTLPESGTYVVEVVGGSFVATGDYSLGLECLVPPSPDAVALSCGSLVAGSMTAPSEADLYTFTGTAGDVVAVTITGAQMAAKVFSPSGTDQTGFFTGTQRLVTLPESGTYVVEVVGGSFVATGDYSLGLECLVPPSPDAVALSCGSLVAGSMTAPSEADLYTFTGTAGDVVAVTITGAQMAAKVFSPSGTDQTGFFTGTQRLVTLPESGTYVVEVVGGSFVATGDYSLGLECLVPPSPDAVALSCGSLVAGSMTAPSEADLYTFTGTAGDVVAVTITGAQMAAKVFSPSGTDQTGFFTGTQRLVTLPESGTYVVEVVGGSFVATGDYSLGLECLVPPSPDAVALSCGSLVAGSMTAPSEADLYTFTGTAGDVVAVTITGAQMAAKVFSPSGTDQTGFFTGTQRLVTLPENGTYVVEVVGGSFVATGDYSLGLECIPGDEDAMLVPSDQTIDSLPKFVDQQSRHSFHELVLVRDEGLSFRLKNQGWLDVKRKHTFI